MLTYKELADKLGVKKDTIIYRARKLPDKSIIKKNGINYLTDSAAETISKTIQQKSKPIIPATLMTLYSQNS